MGCLQGANINKSVNRSSTCLFPITLWCSDFVFITVAIAKAIVYSMAVDGSVRGDSAATPQRPEAKLPTQQTGFLAGSRALDSLDRLITSTESFFHPSNSGQWTLNVSLIISSSTDVTDVQMS
jgi:Proteasome-substrate-size regulator, mid region